MLCAIVIQLEALTSGSISAASGRDVHGLWFRHWQTVDNRVADQMHTEQPARPFTLSPLMGLAAPEQGHIQIASGARAWFRATTLTADLSARLEAAWWPQLPETVTLGSARWRVAGVVVDAAAHPWAGIVDPQILTERHLLAADPPRQWRLHFATPTAFHGAAGHIPFPLPGALVGSWLRRWEAFGPVQLPAALTDLAQQKIMVSSYRLQTVPVRDGKRMTIGCVGDFTMSAPALKPGERAAIDLLAAYAFWAGSGHRTTQGMGLTRSIT